MESLYMGYQRLDEHNAHMGLKTDAQSVPRGRRMDLTRPDTVESHSINDPYERACMIAAGTKKQKEKQTHKPGGPGVLSSCLFIQLACP